MLIIFCIVLAIAVGIITFYIIEENTYHEPIAMQAAKPIIYLYPTEETEIKVSLGKPELITCSYPEYNSDGWEVIANPVGNLKYIENGKNLYSLYYESKAGYDFKVEKDGFIVVGENVAEFLEEKLEILGLNEREAEEFIVYWLPKLEANKYNIIRFEIFQ